MRRAMVVSLAAASAAAGLFCFGTARALAEAVTGTWVNAAGFGDGPIANPDTSSPTVGEEPNDPTFNSGFAVQEMIYSPFTAVTLTNPGDTIVFTGTVELRGTTNSPLTSGTPRTQFRFGLFKDNGDSSQLGWVGYYTSNMHGNPGTPSGVLASKPVGNTSVFLGVGGQAVLASMQGDGTNASLFNDGTYDLMMSIERNAAGELVLNSSIVGVGDRPPVEPYDPDNPPESPGPNIYSEILSATDTVASTNGTYDFDRLGFLTGTNLAADRAAYSNLDVTFIPGGQSSADYNQDGTVDAADYVLWRKSNINGAQGYTDWQSQFGLSTIGSGSLVSAAVPEPTAIVIALIAAVAMISLARPSRVALQPVRSEELMP